jgi:hypothetical protein
MVVKEADKVPPITAAIKNPVHSPEPPKYRRKASADINQSKPLAATAFGS